MILFTIITVLMMVWLQRFFALLETVHRKAVKLVERSL